NGRGAAIKKSAPAARSTRPGIRGPLWSAAGRRRFGSLGRGRPKEPKRRRAAALHNGPPKTAPGLDLVRQLAGRLRLLDQVGQRQLAEPGLLALLHVLQDVADDV